MKKAFLFFLNILLVSTAFSQGEVIVPGSQTKKITSSIVSGQEYVLQIFLPADYNKTNKKYPVVYLMDSQWDFPLVTALYGEQYFDGFIPELIIVGITWGGGHPNPDSLRARDYTPTNETRIPQSGGADKFLSVIQNEIFPLVESNYRADAGDRTLVGCSLGGLFTIYALFSHPDMFNRYVAASPAYNWGNTILNQYEEKYHAAASRPSAKLFMCVGGVELGAPGFEKFAAALNDRHYSNLQIESRVLENTGHSGTKGEGYARGLQFVFKRPSLSLSPAILQQYAGTYQLEGGPAVDMKTTTGSLIASVGNQTYSLLSASETDFYITSSFLNIHFVKDDKGDVSGFQLNRYGSSTFAKKVK